jgi:hypothetical protein
LIEDEAEKKYFMFSRRTNEAYFDDSDEKKFPKVLFCMPISRRKPTHSNELVARQEALQFCGLLLKRTRNGLFQRAGIVRGWAVSDEMLEELPERTIGIV